MLLPVGSGIIVAFALSAPIFCKRNARKHDIRRLYDFGDQHDATADANENAGRRASRGPPLPPSRQQGKSRSRSANDDDHARASRSKGAHDQNDNFLTPAEFKCALPPPAQSVLNRLDRQQQHKKTKKRSTSKDKHRSASRHNGERRRKHARSGRTARTQESSRTPNVRKATTRGGGSIENLTPLAPYGVKLTIEEYRRLSKKQADEISASQAAQMAVNADNSTKIIRGLVSRARGTFYSRVCRSKCESMFCSLSTILKFRRLSIFIL